MEALKGQQVLIITLSVTTPPDTEGKLIEAAAEAGVGYVFLNGWGADTGHPSAAERSIAAPILEARRHVERLGKSAWISVVSGFWYEYSLGGSIDGFGFDFNGRRARIFDGGEAKMNTTTWNQIGRAVAGLLSLKEKPDGSDGGRSLSDYANKCAYVSSFLVSQNDMFRSILRVTGTEESDWDVSHEKAEDRLRIGRELWEKKGDRSGFVQQLYAREFIPGSDGKLSMEFGKRNELLNDVLGLPVEDLDERTKVAAGIAASLGGSS